VQALPAVDGQRLLRRIRDLAATSPIDGGGCSRLALTDDDRRGRDLVVAWMHDLGLDVRVDGVGNVVATWSVGEGEPVMTGSHIDTVRTGGVYDGNLGVLAGLEVIETCQRTGIVPPRPLAVAFFTNEEGARFAPDMLGSLVYVGGMALEEALDVRAIDGARLGDELEAIGYRGGDPLPATPPHAFVELHIVTGVQGISWREATVTGQSNHAGTTPIRLRQDAGLSAARIAVFLRELADRYGGDQVCTVGKFNLFPDLVNVVAARAVLTLDVRNTDEQVLRRAETEIDAFLKTLEQSDGVEIAVRPLARFEPVEFDDRVVAMVERISTECGSTVMRMPSGAGHDAQMLARTCPSGMIFVPSHKGISHNPAEHTDARDIEAGANILLRTILELAATDFV
jgi:N-carbamoyl-L-amino-acid hydrolase